MVNISHRVAPPPPAPMVFGGFERATVDIGDREVVITRPDGREDRRAVAEGAPVPMAVSGSAFVEIRGDLSRVLTAAGGYCRIVMSGSGAPTGVIAGHARVALGPEAAADRLLQNGHASVQSRAGFVVCATGMYAASPDGFGVVSLDVAKDTSIHIAETGVGITEGFDGEQVWYGRAAIVSVSAAGDRRVQIDGDCPVVQVSALASATVIASGATLLDASLAGNAHLTASAGTGGHVTLASGENARSRLVGAASVGAHLLGSTVLDVDGRETTVLLSAAGASMSTFSGSGAVAGRAAGRAWVVHSSSMAVDGLTSAGEAMITCVPGLDGAAAVAARSAGRAPTRQHHPLQG